MKIQTLALGLLLLALPSGCRTYGEIRIGAPKVFTKARVIRDRDREVHWLEEQLEEAGKAEPSFQAYRDLRVFESFYNRFTGRWDAANAQALDLARRAERYQQRIEVAQGQIELKRLQRQLEYVNTAPIASVTDTTVPEKPESKPAEEKDEAALAKLAEQEKKTKKLEDRVQALEEEAKKAEGPALPDPAKIQETKANFSFLDRFTEKKSNREAVMAAIREKLFDDSHDLLGHTLYEVRFDMTLVPGSSSDRYADVRLQITGNQTLSAKDWESLHWRWLDSLQSELHVDQIRLAHRFLSGDPEHPVFVPELRAYLKRMKEARAELKVRKADLALEVLTSKFQQSRAQESKFRKDLKKVEARAREVDRFITILTKVKTGQTLSRDEQATLLEALAGLVKESYYRWLGGILPNPADWETRWLPNPRGVSLPVTVVRREDVGIQDARKEFISRVKALPTSAQILSVQPQERVQNISDVAAKETLLTLIFALEAVLPKGVTVDNYTKFQRRSQTLLHAIRRQPLVIPYVKNGSTFGWLLGPEFRIVDDEAEFLHRPIHHAYTASIRVPAWWTTLKITREGSWIDRKGHRTRKLDLGTTDTQVPGDLSSLTTALLMQAGATQAPRLFDFVDEYGNPHPVQVTVGKPAKILIRGRELWRDPEVYLGHQRADRVEVAADLQGIYASFESVAAPITSSNHTGPLPVTITVKTTAGEDRLSGQALVAPAVPPPPTPEVEEALALKTHFVVGNNQTLHLTFVPKKALPPAYAEITATVVSLLAGGGSSISITVPSPLPDPPHLTLTIPGTPALDRNLYRLEVQLKLKPGATKSYPIIEKSRGVFAYFKDQPSRAGDGSTTKITVPKNGTKPNVGLSVRLPSFEVFKTAYPVLAKTDSKVFLNLTVNGVDSGPLRASLQPWGTAAQLKVDEKTLQTAFKAHPGLLPAAGKNHDVAIEIVLEDGTLIPAPKTNIEMQP